MDVRDTAAPAQMVFRAITQAADNAAMGVTIALVDGPIPELIYVNGGASTLLGFDHEYLMTTPVWQLLAPDEVPRLQEMYAGRQSGEVPEVFETTLMKANGTRLPIAVSNRMIDLDGRPGSVTFFFDISHRKLAEEALRQSERRFRSLIEGAPDGVVILRWPRIVFANKPAAKLLGIDHPSAALGRSILDHLQAEDRPTAEHRVRLMRQQGHRLEDPQIYRARTSDGRDRLVEIASIPLEYEGEGAVLAFARDVTERHAIMQKLMEADKLAAVGTLAAGVAHEINNPLAYVLLNLEFLARQLPRAADDPSLMAELLKRLQDTRQGAERVKTIVRDLQAFTRRDDEVRGPVQLEAVVDTALHMAQHEVRHNAQVVRRFADVPPVHGNATRLEQLLLNLIMNAAHAVAGGSPETHRIEIGLSNADDRVLIEVIDTGCGMSEAVRAQVFDPFFTTKPLGVGTGLGLPICRGIVDALNGEMLIESKEGEGTRVRLWLPASQQPQTPEPPLQVGEPSEAWPRGRVLLVDDERNVLESLELALAPMHDITTASTARDARRALAIESFDVVLCDLVMPGESGIDLYRHVTEHQPDLQDRFIFMTGGAFLPSADEFLAGVPNAHVEKPFDMKELEQLLANQVRASRSKASQPP